MKKLLIASLSCALAAVSTHADWTIVSTFDDQSARDIITDVTNVPDSEARSAVENGRLVLYPGLLFETTTSNVHTVIDMGVDLKAASIAADGPVTAYIEVIHPTAGEDNHKAIVDIVWGLSNETKDTILTLSNAYDSFNAMMRINSGTLGYEILTKNAENKNAYVPIQPLTVNTVYSIWIVADYTLNFAEVYIQGGQWTEQTKLDPGDGSGIWLFRNNPPAETPVNNFQISVSRGRVSTGEKGIDPFYFDNLVIDSTGMNLTMPAIDGGGFGNWGPFPIADAAGNADTGSWMGWVNTEFKPYIWSYSLSSYMFIDEASITAGGSWVYVFN